MVSKTALPTAQSHLPHMELPLDGDVRTSIPPERREELKKALVEMLMNVAQSRATGAKEWDREVTEVDG